MTPERWQQIKMVLCNALELPNEVEREAYLITACGDDTGLRREVDSLLGPFTDNIEAFADNLRSTLGRTVWSEPIGQRLGAYRIVSEIGRGGMGSVYLAERADGQFEKQVAIKLLKRGTDTDEILRKFQSERKILARLEHPNIARLMDAGTTNDGLPYFIMEYVTGLPVTRYVSEKNLSVRERLELFLKICAAVDLAHQSGVIHRDLKPSNILVTASGEPKLLDFGIAKLAGAGLDGDDLTTEEHRRLTVNYASPEQAAGESVSFRTDVYALGAVLYEMLTGTKPHRFSNSNPSLDEVISVLREREPAPPSRVLSDPQLQSEIEGDLDGIVLTALRPKPEARYDSVKDFGADIKRCLEGEKPHARRQRRFPTAIAALLFIGIVLLGGYFVIGPRFMPNSRATLNVAPEKSLAVLPFQDLSTEPDNAFFTAGVQEEILSELAKVADLKVISRASVMQFDPAQPRNLSRIGQSLGVAHVLEGSIQRSGNRVRVNARLTDTRSNAQLWADRYDRELSDVFAIESEVAQAIARQLQAKLSPNEKADMEERPTADMVAYDLYLRGRSIVDSYLDLEEPRTSLLHAVDLLKQATSRDPRFALAHACEARAHNLLYFLELDLDSSRVTQAEKAAKTALELRPESGEAHLAMADHYFRCYRDYERARQELAVARPKLPNSVPFYLLSGYIERRQGLWNEATRSLSKAAELDPANINAVNLLADQYVLLRRFNDATKTYQRALTAGLNTPILHVRIAWTQIGAEGDLRPFEKALQAAPPNLEVGGGTTPFRILIALVKRDYDGAAAALAASSRRDFQNVDYSFYYPREWYEAIIARARGDNDSARAAFTRARAVLNERLKARPDDVRTLGVLAEIEAALDNKDLAIQQANHAVESMPISRDAYEGPLVLQNLAQVYAWTGEKERAIELIQKLLTIPGYVSYGYLLIDPAWEPLRGDPKFDGVLERAKSSSPLSE